MRIFAYQRRDRVTNFGDELNHWLWQQYFPDLIRQTDDTVLVGLGTLLNNALPQRLGEARRVMVFSTGVGYERPLPNIPAHWRIYCVRGPLSARSLQLSPDLALTDGGILLRRWVQPRTQPAHRIAFMPHVHHAVFAGESWAAHCADLGFSYIDPRWPVPQVISAIQHSQLLLAEAMHGAIAADALRVPWIPIISSPRILPFKWQDWCASVQQPYRPQYLPPLMNHYPRYGRGVRSGIQALRHWGHCLRRQGTAIQRALANAAQQRPTLSDDGCLAALTERLEQRLEQLRRDDATAKDLPFQPVSTP